MTPTSRIALAGNPHRLDLDAAPALIILGVLEIEDVLRAVAMIGVEMGKGDHVDSSARGPTTHVDRAQREHTSKMEK